ncbi:MAG: cytochrome c [Alphaproteobacteria bacterium]|nr:cytochrome c [Alphaproteobacteria bacterium]
MRRLTGTISIIGIALAIVVVPWTRTVHGQDPAANVIKYRQTVMKSLGAHMAAIGQIVKGEVGYTHHIMDHAVAISGMSRGLLEIFPPGTGPAAGETRALPDIWEKWGEFQGAALKLNQEAARLVSATGSIDSRLVQNQFAQLGKACGSCHKAFRKEEKQ